MKFFVGVYCRYIGDDEPQSMASMLEEGPEDLMIKEATDREDAIGQAAENYTTGDEYGYFFVASPIEDVPRQVRVTVRREVEFV